MHYHTARLLIRPEQPGDEEACVALWTDPAVTRYVGGPRDPEAVRRAFREGHDRAWTAVVRATGRLVGEVFLLDKKVEGRGEEELNYYFASDAWGRGYATEAAAVVAGKKRLVALIHPENAASRRVAEKLGFRFEKRVRRGDSERDLYVRETG